jgi:Bacterial Ig domain
MRGTPRSMDVGRWSGAVTPFVVLVLIASLVVGGTAFSASRHRHPGRASLVHGQRTGQVACRSGGGAKQAGAKTGGSQQRAHKHHGEHARKRPKHQRKHHRAQARRHHRQQVRKHRRAQRRHEALRDPCRATARALGRDTVSPTIAIVSPAPGSTVFGTITVSGVANDDQLIRSIHLQVDDRTPRWIGADAVWNAQLDTSHLSIGTHRITAFVRDRGLNTSYAEVDVTVSTKGSTTPPEPQPTPEPQPAPDPGPAPSEGGYIHTGPAVLGVFSDGKDGHTDEALEGQMGRAFRGVRNNQRIFEPFPGKDEVRAFDAGAPFSIRNAQTNTLDASGNKVATCWKDWADGTYDWRLAQIVSAIRSDDRWNHAHPYLFAFQKEMNLNDASAASFATHPTCGTSEQYKAASRHLWNYFKDAGVLWRFGGEVVIAWVPSGSAYRNGDAKDWDPNLGTDGSSVVGDYYDLVGIDIYDRPEDGGHLKTTDPHWLFDPAWKYAVARGKQLIIPEFGVAEDSVNDGVSEKAQVFSRVASVLSGYGNGVPGSVFGLYYSNVHGYWPDTTPTSLSAFVKMAREPFFSG